MGAIVIAIENGKGGVGKTTTAKILIYELLKQGHRVLAIDLDPAQSNLTTGFGITPYPAMPTTNSGMEEEDIKSLAFEAYNGEHNLVKIFQGGIKPIPLKVQSVENLWFFPAAKELETVANACSAARDLKLRQFLRTIADEYDYIVIDTNPGITTLINNAVLAADKLVIPIQAENNASNGMSAVLNKIGQTISEYEGFSSLKDLYFVPSMIQKRSSTHKSEMETIETGLLEFVSSIPGLCDKKAEITDSVYHRELFKAADSAANIYCVQQYIELYDNKERALRKKDIDNGTNTSVLTILGDIAKQITK